jgi:hypothetical protein
MKIQKQVTVTEDNAYFNRLFVNKNDILNNPYIKPQ